MNKIAFIPFTGIAFLLSFLLFGCISSPEPVMENETPEMIYTEIPFQDLKSSIDSVDTEGHGFIVQAYIGQNDYQYIIVSKEIINNVFDLPLGAFSITNFVKKADNTVNYGLDKLIEKDKIYTLYIGVYYNQWDNDFFARVDRIEGLLTEEEANELKLQRDAEAAEALAEANIFDPANFYIVPENFKPANYKSTELFEAVVQADDIKNDTRLYGPLIQMNFVSDVVFISQKGTMILFKSFDNSISQQMNIDEPSGIMGAQNVRIYYEITKPTLIKMEWTVIAIELME